MSKDSQQPKIISLEFVEYFAGRFGLTLGFSMLTALVASFCFDVYHVSESLAGIAVGAFILAAMVSRLFAGRYLDVVGRKRMLAISGVAYLATTALYLVPLPFALFVVARALNGLAFGFYSNTIVTLSNASVPPQRLSEGIGYLSLANTLSSAIGPFVGLYLYQTLSATAMFGSCVTFSLIVAGIALATPVKNVELSAADRQRILKEFHLSDCFDFSCLPISCVSAAVDFFYFGVSAFIATYTIELGIPQAASWFFVAYSATLLLTRPATGRLMDRRGDAVVMIPSLLCAAVGFVLLGTASSVAAIVLAGVLMALGRGTFFSAGQAVAIRNLPANRIGLATSTYFLLIDTADGLGPMVLGLFVVPLGGYGPLFLVSAAFSLAIVATYCIIMKRKK